MIDIASSFYFSLSKTQKSVYTRHTTSKLQFHRGLQSSHTLKKRKKNRAFPTQSNKENIRFNQPAIALLVYRLDKKNTEREKMACFPIN